MVIGRDGVIILLESRPLILYAVLKYFRAITNVINHDACFVVVQRS